MLKRPTPHRNSWVASDAYHMIIAQQITNIISVILRGVPACDKLSIYCAYHVLVQPNFRRYNFYFLSDQAQTHLDYFNI